MELIENGTADHKSYHIGICGSNIIDYDDDSGNDIIIIISMTIIIIINIIIII